MGGDLAPVATTKGAVLAAKELPEDVTLVLIGDEVKINELLKKEKKLTGNFEIIPTTEVIEMSDHPTKAYSRKINSSINVGFHLLKENKIQGFCSAGNTGAILVGSMFTVKPIPGVIRPCITSVLPKENGSVGILLDVGTNADCKPDVLYQFAVLGSLYARHVYNMENPRVGLLNIGEEEKKGNLLTQATYDLMKDTTSFAFAGNIEGRDLFNGKADVIVCDGFTGNVVLKQAEAFYTLIKKRGLSDEYFDRFNYELYGGTPVLGVNATVVKGHGISNEIAIKNMILLTKEVAEANLTEKIKEIF